MSHNQVLKKQCCVCKTAHTISVPQDDYFKWLNGSMVQDAFPYLSTAMRELLISGTCEECFDKLFKEE